MKQTIVDKLKENKTISDEEFKFLLTTADNDILHELQTTAQEIAIANHGNIIKARGLIEGFRYYIVCYRFLCGFISLHIVFRLV